MKSLEIARRLSDLGELPEAAKAYTMVLSEISSFEDGNINPEIRFEAALFLAITKIDIKTACSELITLHKNGHFKNEVMQALIENCYADALEDIAKQYQKNQHAIAGYKYTFSSENEFVPLDDLKLLFFPINENGGYIPFDTQTGEFLEYVDINNPIITRNFFKNLDNPIFAENVYSQYELEYLNDNVRKSEWCAKENHIYLYYSDFYEFCAWAQVLDFASLLNSKKIVLLLGKGQDSLYPINFKEEFGIDYSTYTVKPFTVDEITRLIFHTQLSSHNGGDFFNEIFDSHPNLILEHSVFFSTIEDIVAKGMEFQKKGINKINIEKTRTGGDFTEHERSEFFLSQLKGKGTEKDVLSAFLLNNGDRFEALDKNSRITPVVFFQPHFANLMYDMEYDAKTGNMIMSCEAYENMRKHPIFAGFKYIKTFTPIRRITTSYAATIKFMLKENNDYSSLFIADTPLAARIKNQSFFVDPHDRLFKDSRIVRFEDGKLNPKATFTKLAEFLDLPYTETMTYCSYGKMINPEMMDGNARGFDPVTVYRKYEEFATDEERYLIEYFMQSAMKAYGYENNYYDMSQQSYEALCNKLESIDTRSRIPEKQTIEFIKKKDIYQFNGTDGENQTFIDKFCYAAKTRSDSVTCEFFKTLYTAKKLVSPSGRPLELMKLLEPDPELLETELYR